MKLDVKPYEEKMKKSMSVYKEQLETVRAGRANPGVLRGIDDCRPSCGNAIQSGGGRYDEE